MTTMIRNRAVLTIAIIVAAAGWLTSAKYLRAIDGSTGLTLSSGAGIAILVLYSLPGLAAALFAALVGGWRRGMLTVGAGLGALAAISGPIDGWMMRTDLPGAYGWLMLELLLWYTGLTIAGMVFHRAITQFTRGTNRPTEPELPWHLEYWRQKDAWGPLATATVTGGILSLLLIRDSDTGQVLLSLLLAFGAGGWLAHMLFPTGQFHGVFLAPALIGMVGYTYVLCTHNDEIGLLAMWHRGLLPGTALALPVHYVGAGTLGCALGLGWAQRTISKKLDSATMDDA